MVILDASARRRFIASKVVFEAGFFVFVSILVGVVGFAYGVWVSQKFAVGLMNGFGLALEEYPQWTYPLLAFVGFIVLPITVFLPVIVPWAVMWKNPRRIVVFRRFHTRLENSALRRIVPKHLGPYGHVFTLSDTRIHRSVFVRVPLLLGQLNFLNFRLRRVHDERGIAELGEALERRWRLNVNWILSPRKIFPIETSDEYWQQCVGLLLEKADLIVMEVSNFSDAMAWEIAELGRRDLLKKTILLMRSDGDINEDPRLNLESKMGVQKAAIFTYKKTKIDAPKELHTRISAVLATSVDAEPRVPLWQVFLTIAGNLSLSLILASAALLAVAPSLYPEWTARHSPFKSQVLTVYLYEGELSYLDRLVKQDWKWTHAKLRETVVTGTSIPHNYALIAIGKLGDEGDIPLLVDALARRSSLLTDDQRLKSLIRWHSSIEEKSLTALMLRLGRPALPALFAAISATPVFPFDNDLNGDLYQQYILPNLRPQDDALFVDLLHCQNQTGRFLAGWHLGSRKDARAVPVLREMVEVYSPSLSADWVKEYLNEIQATSEMNRKRTLH
jgi:hypothetical protein